MTRVASYLHQGRHGRRNEEGLKGLFRIIMRTPRRPGGGPGRSGPHPFIAAVLQAKNYGHGQFDPHVSGIAGARLGGGGGRERAKFRVAWLHWAGGSATPGRKRKSLFLEAGRGGRVLSPNKSRPFVGAFAGGSFQGRPQTRHLTSAILEHPGEGIGGPCRALEKKKRGSP